MTAIDRVLVTGASGFLGRYVLRSAARRYEVVGTYHDTPIDSSGVETVQVDLTDPPFPELQAFDPDAIIQCAALANVDACERNPGLARELNTDLAANVAEFADTVSAHLVHISTDAVFDGSSGRWSEFDQPSPKNVYGRTKLGGERAVLECSDDALIVRTNFFGWGDGVTLAEWMLSTLEAGEELTGLADVHFTPMYAGDLAHLLCDLLEISASGILHLPGTRRLSKLEFGRELADVFELSDEQIIAIDLDDLDLEAPRPKDLSLDGTKARVEFDLDLPSIRPGLERMRADR